MLISLFLCVGLFFSKFNFGGVNFTNVIGKANYLLDKLKLREAAGYKNQTKNADEKLSQNSDKTRTVMSSVDKVLLENIQSYVRNFSAIDRSNDEYANEKMYRHDDQYLQYMVSCFKYFFNPA